VPEIEFTWKQISSFATRLSELNPPPNALERELLLALFAIAAEKATISTGTGTATLPLAGIKGQAPGHRGGFAVTAAVITGQQVSADQLKEQLLSAYIPGNDFDAMSEGAGAGGNRPTEKITGDQLIAGQAPRDGG